MELDKRATFAIQFTSSAPPCERRDPCGLYTVSIIDRNADGMRPAVRVTIGDRSIDIHDHTCVEDLVLFERVVRNRGDALPRIVRAARDLVIDDKARERHATETHGLLPATVSKIVDRLSYYETALGLAAGALS